MCIIACKPIGLQMPDEDTITNMWFSNPDGAGLMYNHKGKVHIEKGFMKIDDFLDALDRISKSVDLTQCGVVMHFRIATHGGTRPENTHPFPISSSIPVLKKLRLTTDVGVAHNGIIHNTPRSKDISDTMEYIAAQLAPLKAALPRFWENKNAMLLVKNAIDSKMAFLDGTGKIRTIGDFTEHEGLLYSNHSYKDYWRTTTYNSYWSFDSDEDGKWSSGTYTYDAMDFVDPKFYEQCGQYLETHYLMPISEVEGAFYTNTDGEMYEDDSFLVYLDAKNRIWVMDWEETNVAFQTNDIVCVYDANGNRLHYDFQSAEPLPCYKYEDGLLYFPTKNGGDF